MRLSGAGEEGRKDSSAPFRSQKVLLGLEMSLPEDSAATASEKAIR